MTATLSQDPLERFFSVMRHSCGGNDHPDPKMFAQVYRLASCFSLVRPPKGCNVSGKDLLKTLLGAQGILTSPNKDKEIWLQNIDIMVERSEPLLEGSLIDEDHDYNEAVTSDAVQSYIAGYIVRKLRNTTKCVNCLQALQMKAGDGRQLQRNDVINKMDLYGGLIYASNELFDLTKQLENTSSYVTVWRVHTVGSLLFWINFFLPTKMGLLAALAVNIVGGAVIYGTGGIGAPLIAPLLGFSSGGIVAGSTAAAAQAYYGNVVAGSIISQLTSIAMVAPTL
ncbi:unnamed protein product [Parnassius mnemosyne]|uniref:Transposable element P transposase-like RNase H C-terminal domain-containing protein n=1 Tax=Parnassius mnemosyne TaxID=213953 RepID=A0AAV1KF93_9NEOP